MKLKETKKHFFEPIIYWIERLIKIRIKNIEKHLDHHFKMWSKEEWINVLLHVYLQLTNKTKTFILIFKRFLLISLDEILFHEGFKTLIYFDQFFILLFHQYSINVRLKWCSTQIHNFFSITGLRGFCPFHSWFLNLILYRSLRFKNHWAVKHFCWRF